MPQFQSPRAAGIPLTLTPAGYLGSHFPRRIRVPSAVETAAEPVSNLRKPEQAIRTLRYAAAHGVIDWDAANPPVPA